MDKNKYNFLSNKTQNYYQTSGKKIKLFEFYQLCLFENEKYNRFNIRKIYYDNDFNIVKHQEFMISKNDYSKIINLLPKHKYSTHSTYDLKTICFPSESEIISATSELLETNSRYYDFAKF